MLEKDFYVEQIKKLKKEKNAVILAHNYERPEIQDVADLVGDSLGLSQEASKTDASIIVFCGVHFMAETAKIISPNKKVLLPDVDAGCSLADSITIEQLRIWKKENPNAVVVSYVNTTAEIKSESDYCCTSSNAVEVVRAIPTNKDILFLPDRYLGNYAAAVTRREINVWNGSCHVHEKIGDINLNYAKRKYPNAEILVHPECSCSSSCIHKSALFKDCKNTKIFSTSGMVNYVKKSDASEFIIATETGIIHQLKKVAPEKKYRPVSKDSICEYMKLTTLEKLYNSLQKEVFEVVVPETIAKKAIIPIKRMLEIC
ncbi:MAG: quinolinate synthase NadA [Ignavibacteriales bacterium]|nr:quinolinate synthase NadA [Ignavibacteriales bacterium]